MFRRVEAGRKLLEGLGCLGRGDGVFRQKNQMLKNHPAFFNFLEISKTPPFFRIAPRQ